MATTYQKYYGRFYMSAASCDVGGNTVTVPAGYYYIRGYTGEATLQLCEKLQEQIRAIGGAYATATVAPADTVGNVYINLQTTATITWTSTTLRDILGFTATCSGASAYEAPNRPRYTWFPANPASDHPVNMQNFWAPGSTSYIGRSKDGMSWSRTGATYNEAMIEYQALPVEDVLTPTTGTGYRDLQTFFTDVVHAGQTIRAYYDRTINTSTAYKTCRWASEDDTLGTFIEYAKRRVRNYNGRWDVSFLLYEATDSAPTVSASGQAEDILVFSDDTEFTATSATYATKKTFRFIRDADNAATGFRVVVTGWLGSGAAGDLAQIKVQCGTGGSYDELTLSTDSATEAVLSGDLTFTGNSPTDTLLTVNVQLRRNQGSGTAHVKYTDIYAVY